MPYTVKQIPSHNHWNGREGHTPLWLILHGTDANTNDYDGAYETAGWFQNNSVSANYVVGRRGLVAQCVQESDAPYANGGVTNTPTRHHDPWWSSNLNPNLVTISIEHVKHAGNNNADALTPAQQQAAFELIYDICKRNTIPMRLADAHGGITGHFSMDPLERAYCPGNYPWNELWTYLTIRQEQEKSVSEVAHFNQADQFLPGKSTYECGFYATYVAKSMGQQAPILSPQQISDLAQAAYARYNGSNSSANMNGMSLPQLYALLKEVGLHYQGTKLDLAHIQAWLRTGYPVIVAVAEPCIRDLDLNDSVPYPWTPTGNHVIVLTGLNGNNFFARDTANIIAPNTLRPGPRRYDAQALARGLVSATAIVPAWLPIPTKDIDPNAPAPIRVGIAIPAGWHDDGAILTAKNGIKVIKGFRAKILSGPWDAENVPYEIEHPMDGEYATLQMGTEGAGQLFRDCYLRWTPQHGIYFDRIGNALSVSIQHNKELQANVDTLTRELAVKAIATPLPPEVLSIIVQVENSLKPLVDLYTALHTLKGN